MNNQLPNSPSGRRRFLLVLLAAAPAACATTASGQDRTKRLGEQLMCVCGCFQTLTGCNHLGCKSSTPMRAELASYVAEGKSDQEILDAFTAKYGTAVLSAPPVKGWFNISAWLMPFAALITGGLVVIYFLKNWKTAPVPAPIEDAATSKYRQQIEDELKKFTPED